MDKMHKIYTGDFLDEGRIISILTGGLTPRCLLVTNTTVGKLYLKKVKRSLEKRGIEVSAVEMPDGEKYKNLYQLRRLYKTALEKNITRKCFAVALGGGVVTDITGFFAATFMRGIEFINIPTTLLAMTDAAVGGKTGVDLKEGKNLVGAFRMPLAVLCSMEYLKTLPAPEMKNGLAEIIKYALLDKKFFAFMDRNLKKLKNNDGRILPETVDRAAALKSAVVKADFRESGYRKLLNLGHTFGHAIETSRGYRIKHGEAVASGMLEVLSFGAFLGVTKKAVSEKAKDMIERAGFKRIEFNAKKLTGIIMRDKKVIDRDPVFVLLRDIGQTMVKEVPLVKLRGWLATRRRKNKK